MLNDRYCITYGTQTLFSPEDVNDCCTGSACGGSSGCNGGYPSSVWSWFTTTGVCTGGDYSAIGAGTTCKPYSLPPCAHHVTPVPPLVQCPTLSPTGVFPTPACTGTCSEASYGVSYANDKKKAKSAYSLNSVQSMQLDIIKNGPITVTFDVYSDFLMYAGGVYQLTPSATLEGGHCVKITGWGVDAISGLPYWQCNNQWGPSWGKSSIICQFYILHLFIFSFDACR